MILRHLKRIVSLKDIIRQLPLGPQINVIRLTSNLACASVWLGIFNGPHHTPGHFFVVI